MISHSLHRLLPALVIALLLTGCNASPTTGDAWAFNQRDGHSNTSDVSGDTPPLDVAPDTGDTSPPQDTAPDATPGEWSGWFVHEPFRSYFIPDSELVLTGDDPTLQRTCQVGFVPEQPEYVLEPKPPRRDYWRLRQPAATRDAGDPVPLSSQRVGLVQVSGQKVGADDLPTDARITNASVARQTCDTLESLGRCGAPNPGDLCFTGIQTFGGLDDDPELSFETNAGRLRPDDIAIDVTAVIDFAPRIADAGRDVSIDFDLPRYDSGRQDGRIQQDWSIDEAISGAITRRCSSWGSVTTVTYDLSDADGWIHRIPADERPGNRGLILVNLETGVGRLPPSAPPQPDAGDPPSPDCGTSPMAFWFAREYTPEN